MSDEFLSTASNGQDPKNVNITEISDDDINREMSIIHVLQAVKKGSPKTGREKLAAAGLLPTPNANPPDDMKLMEEEGDVEMSDDIEDNTSKELIEDIQPSTELQENWADLADEEQTARLNQSSTDVEGIIADVISDDPEVGEDHQVGMEHVQIHHELDPMKDNFRMLYDGLSIGINQVLQIASTIQKNQTAIMSEIRVLKDGQQSLAASIKQLSSTCDTISAVQGGVQAELLAIKEEFSICTVSFDKIVSGMSHLSTSIPVGKLPNISSYQSTSLVSADPMTSEGITTVPMSSDKLKEVLMRLNVNPNKIETYIGLLKNRTSKYFAANLPTVFPGIPLSHDLVTKLLSLGSTMNRDQLIMAIKLLISLEQEVVDSPPPIIATTVTQSAPAIAKPGRSRRLENKLDF